MSDNIKISCIVDTNNPAAKLGFEVWVDDKKFIDINHITEEQPILLEISDDDADHELRFIMKNKLPSDTKIDEHGNIISDSMLSLKDITVDEIPLGHLFTKLAVYNHNFNGTSIDTVDQFYGDLGCNGTVSLKFATPIYIWLLEQQ